MGVIYYLHIYDGDTLTNDSDRLIPLYGVKTEYGAEKAAMEKLKNINNGYVQVLQNIFISSKSTN